MDVLRQSYAGASDDEDDGDQLGNRRRPFPSRNHKRIRSDGPSHWAEPYPPTLPFAPAPPPEHTAAPPLPGRYISKRERAIMAASASYAAVPDPGPSSTPTVVTSSVVGSISDSIIPYDVLKLLRCEATSRGELNKCAVNLLAALNGHTNAVNTLQWSKSHAHLLASAGMDQTVRVWNVWSKENKLARVFSYHGAAVKDVRWSPRGLSLLSCGYDCSSRLVDVEKGIETQLFKEDQVVTSIRFHPGNSELFLSGGLKGSLRLWDIRVGKVVNEYLKSLGPILDIEFSADAKHFISSSDVSQSNISENAIIVWDVSRAIPLSNQVYTEAYTCPCIRYHPYEASFIAQSNGNYIAIFSARSPFRLDRYKRYEKHVISGFPVKCSFSPDGKEIISGSADGHIYIYDYRSSELIRKIKAFDEACIDVAFHPLISNIIASCSWKGDISVLC